MSDPSTDYAARLVKDARALYDKMMHGDSDGDDELTIAESNRLHGILTLDIPRLASRVASLEAELAEARSLERVLRNELRDQRERGGGWLRRTLEFRKRAERAEAALRRWIEAAETNSEAGAPDYAYAALAAATGEAETDGGHADVFIDGKPYHGEPLFPDVSASEPCANCKHDRNWHHVYGECFCGCPGFQAASEPGETE